MIQEVDLVEVTDVHGIGKDPSSDELRCWLPVIAHGKPIVATSMLSAATQPDGAVCFQHRPALNIAAHIEMSPRFVRRHPVLSAEVEECAVCEGSKWRVVRLPPDTLPSAPKVPKGVKKFSLDSLRCLQGMLQALRRCPPGRVSAYARSV